MPSKTAPNYLACYPPALTEPVWRLIEEKRLAAHLLGKYPKAHAVRTDKALYDYVQALRAEHMRNAPQPSKVAFDAKLRDLRQALGTHTSIVRIQGSKLKNKREIHVAAIFRDMPEAFLRMIVVHELAHLKESAHDKAFYQLCRHMAADYHQLEFDLRVYLTHLAAGGEALWVNPPVDPPPGPKTGR